MTGAPGAEAGPEGPGRAEPSAGRDGRLAGLLPGLLVAGVVLAGLAVLLLGRTPSTDLEPDRVLVAPVQSAADPAAESLAREATDLLSQAMEGARGLHPVDARAVRSEWHVAPAAAPVFRREALASARRLDAGWLLLGELALSPERVSLTCSLYSAVTGDIEARASVLGPPDSLPLLVDGLVSRLAAFDADVRERAPLRSSDGQR